MARSVGKPDTDQKRQAPPPKDVREFLPPSAPRGKSPYDPVPIIPDEPVPIMPAPIEVDPPSRPHLIARSPTYVPPDILSSMSEFARGPSGGLIGMIAQAGIIDALVPGIPPAGGLVALLQDSLCNNRKHGD